MSNGLLDIQIPVHSFIGSLRSLLLYLKKKLRKSNAEQIGGNKANQPITIQSKAFQKEYSHGLAVSPENFIDGPLSLKLC